MAINLNLGPDLSKSMGTMGLAAGQKQYAVRKQATEHQQRIQRVGQALQGIQTAAQIAQPFVQQAIRRSDTVFQNDQSIKHEKARRMMESDPELIRAQERGNAIRERARFNEWHTGANKTWQYLKSQGPSEKGMANVNGWGRMSVGGGNGNMTTPQIQQAMGTYLAGSGERAGFDSNAGMTNVERAQANKEVLPNGDIRYFPERGPIQEIQSPANAEKSQYREQAISLNRVIHSSNIGAIKDGYRDGYKMADEVFPDDTSANRKVPTGRRLANGQPEYTTAKAKYVEDYVSGLRQTLPKPVKIPWSKGVVPQGEAADPGSNFVVDPATTQPQPQHPPQPQPQTQTQPQPEPEPKVNPASRQIPEPYTEPPPGGRNVQEIETDQRLKARKSELLQQNLPQLHKMYNSPEMSRKVREMGEKEFFVPEFAKDRALPLRQYGWFGPEYKGPVAERSFWEQITFQDPKPHKYDKEELGEALKLIQAVNEREMRLVESSAGQMNLYKSGGQGAKLHVAREQAARWIADVTNQLDLSQKTWEQEGGWTGPDSAKRAGPKKGAKWLVGRPIPLPASVTEMTSQLRGQLKPIGSPHSGRSLGWGSGIPVQ